ncbi:MAG: ABC transporter ATP-binding protein, partial [Gemmatimonadota bacterium]
GMKQKLSLSCCLVHRPDILLLDEPTFGVDPISRRELWMILHEMVNEGITIVLTTSYLDEAERCDRVALLDEGRTLALDDPASLQRSLDGTLWVIRTDRPRDARDALRAHPPVGTAMLFGDVVHALTAGDPGPESLSALLEAHEIEVRDIARTEPSLEDVFIQLVAGKEGTAHG